MTDVRFFAPGRVNLIGEHTDYGGGLVLPAAIDLGVTVSGGACGDGVRVRSPGYDVAHWVDAVLAELGRPPVALDAEVSTTVPVGTGLASSAALGVALAGALARAASIPLEPLELARVARGAEERATGVPCGIMDQAASALGRAGHALLLDCATLEHRHVRLPDGLALLVLGSGLRRRLGQTAYAERRRELERALAGARDPVALRRLRHFESENERVRAVVTELEREEPDLRELGRLFAASHASLRDDFEVSTPELDRLVELAAAHGALAARLTGAGFGGSVLALAHRDEAAAIGRAVVRSHDRGAAYVCSAGDGAH